MAMLKKIDIKGYRSIKNASLELRALNVLIGANGAGKSNFVSFFKMLNEMMGGRLQLYIGRTGRAKSILHFGPKVTLQLEAHLEFVEDQATDWYDLRLFHAAGDTLVFAEETLKFIQPGYAKPRLLRWVPVIKRHASLTKLIREKKPPKCSGIFSINAGVSLPRHIT